MSARQTDRKRRAPPRPALHLDRAAVRLRDPLADGEAEAGAGALAGARARGIGAPKTIEDVRQIPGRDADAGVGHREHGASVIAPQLHGDLTAARRVLDRVLDEI